MSGPYSTHYKSHITALEKFTESKFDSGFITWFTELFLKYIHFKSSDPYSDSDMLVYKSTSIVSAFTQQNFNLHESLGNFDSKTVDTLKDTLSQFQKRSVDNASEAKKKRKLEEVNPEIFINFTNCREFIGHLMNKLFRYKNHLDVFKLHREKGSTTAPLFYCNFPAPFLSDDEEFVQAYNALIKTFQDDAISLIMSRLSSLISILESKLNAIKVNLGKYYEDTTLLDSSLDELSKSVYSGLEGTFKAAINKVDRCHPRPFVAGVQIKKRKTNVKFNNSAKNSRNISLASSLNSSISSVSSNTTTKSILRNNNQTASSFSVHSTQHASSKSSSTSSQNNQQVSSSTQNNQPTSATSMSIAQNNLTISSSANNPVSNQNFRFFNSSKSKFDPYARTPSV